MLLAVLLSLCISLVSMLFASSIMSTRASLSNKDVLFVTAHPDDESMFFGPSITYATNPSRNNTVSLLCLSTGNNDGIGLIRRQELLEASGLLGIPRANVYVIDDVNLQDGMANNWDPGLIENYIEKVMVNKSISTIITFDSRGVSDHINHRQVNAGVRKLVAGERHLHTDIYELRSVSIFRKYIFPIDAIMSFLRSGPSISQLIVASRNELHLARMAMYSAHRSQMVWYRWFWIYFSRYMLINDLVLVDANIPTNREPHEAGDL